MRFIDKIRETTRQARQDRGDLAERKAQANFVDVVGIIQDEIEFQASKGNDIAFFQDERVVWAYIWKLDDLEKEFPGFKFSGYADEGIEVEW